MPDDNKTKPRRGKGKSYLNLAESGEDENPNKNNDLIKPNPAQIEARLLNWVSGAFPFLGAEPFGDEYRVFIQNPTRKNGRVIIRVIDGKATIVSEDDLFGEVWQQMWDLPTEYWEYKVGSAIVNTVVELFKRTKHRLLLSQPPEVFCWDSEKDKIAYTRLPDPPPLMEFWPSEGFKKNAPLYSDFINRSQHPYEVRQFLGSALDVKSDRKMVLWNHGHSDGGKSIFLTFLLQTIFGDSGFGTLEIDPAGNAFTKESIANKLVVFGDEVKADILTSLWFKQTTGSPKQKVNPKGKAAFDAAFRNKFIFASNYLPKLPRKDTSYSSRVILNRVANISQNLILTEAEVERRLKEEFPFILADIWQAYKDLHGRKIKMPDGCHEESFKAHEEPYQMMFDELYEHFPEQGENDSLVTSRDFDQAVSRKLQDYREITKRGFIKFLKDRYDIKVGHLKKFKTGKVARVVPFIKPIPQ